MLLYENSLDFSGSSAIQPASIFDLPGPVCVPRCFYYRLPDGSEIPICSPGFGFNCTWPGHPNR